MEVWNSGGHEARCRRAGTEVYIHGDFEVRRKRVDVGVWNAGGALQACTRGGRGVWMSRALEASRWRDNVEAWRYGTLEARCRPADVEA